jgi:hypothetical protein
MALQPFLNAYSDHPKRPDGLFISGATTLHIVRPSPALVLLSSSG